MRTIAIAALLFITASCACRKPDCTAITDECECQKHPSCKTMVETCYCPPCDPALVCVCGGGRFLGCSFRPKE